MIGIYKITNPKGKIYIGQSVNIEKRWNKYKQLHCKKQPKIYNSLKKYGVDKHKFDIIQLCDIEQLNELEKYYVDLFQTFNSKHGLNLKDGGGSFAKYSDDSKLKISIAGLGRKHSLETRKKMSKSRKHTEITQETRLKMKLGLIGHSVSKDARMKISNANSKIVLNTESGIYYIGVKEAAIAHKLNYSTLKNKLYGQIKNNTPLIYV